MQQWPDAVDENVTHALTVANPQTSRVSTRPSASVLDKNLRQEESERASLTFRNDDNDDSGEESEESEEQGSDSENDAEKGQHWSKESEENESGSDEDEDEDEDEEVEIGDEAPTSKGTRKLQREILVTVVTGVEAVNKNFGGGVLKLDGWSDAVNSEVSRYDDSLDRIRRKYFSKSSLPPEAELALLLVSSATSHHLNGGMKKVESARRKEERQKKINEEEEEEEGEGEEEEEEGEEEEEDLTTFTTLT